MLYLDYDHQVNMTRSPLSSKCEKSSKKKFDDLAVLFFFLLLSRQFLQREQYPFIAAQSGVSSKVYHWINCNRSTSKPGSLWYLISMDWWARWETSSMAPSSETFNPSMHKKNSLTKLNKLTNVTEHK